MSYQRPRFRFTTTGPCVGLGALFTRRPAQECCTLLLSHTQREILQATMGEEAVPLLRRASTSLAFLSSLPKNVMNPRMFTSKLFIILCFITVTFPILFWHRDTLRDLSVPYARPFGSPMPQFVAHGKSACLPSISEGMIQESVEKHATCRKFAPFTAGRARIATVTAHFGTIDDHYQKAFRTHLVHSMIHGTEVRVMCDPIIDALWNKPAYILDLLMRETLKPAKERLEWIMWVDRDTVILDQCRPISSFLPPIKSPSGSWWRREGTKAVETNLLVTKDFNGLNNGVFILRVNEWAISLFTAILAFRHYQPDVELPFTEQSAMQYVLQTDEFKTQTQFVPQHWFNSYDDGGAAIFAGRQTDTGLAEATVRRGDYLVHFAGHPEKGRAIEEYSAMLLGLGDVWEKGTVQRDTSQEIMDFWKELGYYTHDS
jgi:mannan polymerase II complex MNN10 subunit